MSRIASNRPDYAPGRARQPVDTSKGTQMRFLAFSMLMAAGVPAFAQACPTPDLLSAKPKAFSEVFKTPSANALKKGEFETTAEFEARKAALSGPPQSVLSIALGNDAFEYNADAQQYLVKLSRLGSNLTYSDLRGVPEDIRELFGTFLSTPIEFAVSKTETPMGTYEAQNGFGAKFTIEKRQETVLAVFEGRGRDKGGAYDNLFSVNESYKTSDRTFPISLAQAKEWAGKLSLVALINPKRPFFLKATRVREPTASLPLDITSDVSILFADIQCIGVLGPNGDVLASWATR
jgi:hypothetical protein